MKARSKHGRRKTQECDPTVPERTTTAIMYSSSARPPTHPSFSPLREKKARQPVAWSRALQQPVPDERDPPEKVFCPRRQRLQARVACLLPARRYSLKQETVVHLFQGARHNHDPPVNRSATKYAAQKKSNFWQIYFGG